MDDLAFWRNLALVFLIIQFFVLILVAVAVSYLLVRVTANLHVHAQKAALKAQAVGDLVVEKSDEYAAKARAPIVKGNAGGAGSSGGSYAGRNGAMTASGATVLLADCGLIVAAGG